VAARIALVYIGLIAALLLGLGAYLADFVSAQYVSTLEEGLRREAGLVAVASRAGIATHDQAALQELASSQATSSDVRITVIAPDGVVLADSEADPATMENHAGRPEVAAALAGATGEAQRLSATRGVEFLYVAVPVQGDGQVLGVARVAIHLLAVRGAIDHLIATVGSVLVASAFIAGLLAVLLARATVGRLASIANAANQLAHGDLEARVPDAGEDEVGALARAFNQMAAGLRTQLDALARERSRLVDVVRHMSDGLIIADEQGSVRLLNPAAAQLLGVDATRARGESLMAVLRDHELAGLAREALAQRAETGQRLVDLSGAPNRVSVLASADVIPAGDPAESRQVLVLLRDVSDLRRTELVRREFAVNVSHELRTPVAALKALVETLEEGALEEPAEARGFVAHMHREVDRLARLVEEVLQLSRIESKQAPMRLQPADIGAIVRATVERFEPQAAREGVALQVAVAPDLPRTLADPERIEQVLASLVHNALKFTPADGTVSVSVQWRAPVLEVAVADTGIGIAPDLLNRLFERFFKVDRSRTGGGTGLGLAIAKHVVEAHGGRIWAESAGEGRGARFVFTLPARPA
jgi:two-component system phosphate regulon sensor histidine kinase PhoR